MSIRSFLDQLNLGWTARRNRLIASAAFQRRAAAFPVTRPVAQAYARHLFDLSAGFIHAQTAAAMVDSGLLAALSRAPMSTAEVAKLAALPPRGVDALLTAAAALALVEPIGDGWTLGRRGAALAGSPGVAAMIAHHRLLYADLADPLAMLRGDEPGRLAALWRYDGAANRKDVAAYSRLMSESQPMVADQALAAYGFSRHRRLLDIGGGDGAFVAKVGARYPQLELGVFDRPAVFGAAPPPGHVIRHAGDFHRDPLPSGYDLVTLVRVLHDHDDGPARALLALIRAALPPHGRLLIVEPMAGRGRAGASVAAYFSLYLAAMGTGRPRAPADITAMLRAAGFTRVRRLRTPLPIVASALLAKA